MMDNLRKDDKINSYNIFREGISIIGWKPENVQFNMMIVAEGKYTKQIDGSIDYEYNDKANANNPVIQYFINKYPPSV